jgi:hypothetical protein
VQACHPNYASELIDKGYFSTTEIWNIISAIVARGKAAQYDVNLVSQNVVQL